MKLLAVFFLAGLALASAVPVPSRAELSLKDVEELDQFLSTISAEIAERSIRDDVREKLKNAYERILERIREAIESGRTVNDRFLNKLRDIRERFKGGSGEMDDKARGLLDKFTGKGRDVYQKILEKLGIQKRSVGQRSIKDDVRNRLREAYDQVLERIREAVESGKTVRDSFLDKLRDIRGRLKGDSSELDDKARGLLDRFTGKARDTWQNILDRLGIQKRSVASEFEQRSIKDDVRNRLREAYDQVLERIREAVESGKTVRDSFLDKLRDIRGRLKGDSSELDDKARGLLDRFTGKARDVWQNILEKLGIQSKRSIASEFEQRSIKDDIRNRLREAYDQVLERIREAVESGKTVRESFLDKLRDIRGRLKGDSSELDDKARGLLDRFTGKARDAWQNILDRLGIQSKRSVASEFEQRSIKDDIRNRLKEAYDQVLERLRESVESGKAVPDRFLDKLRDIRGRLKGDSSELDDKARGLLDKFTGKARDTWQNILDRLGIQSKRSIELAAEEEEEKSDLVRRLREKFEKILQRIKDALEKGNKFDNAVQKLRKIHEKLRELGADLSEKGKELVEKLREKVTDYIDRIIQKVSQKRAVDFKDLLRRLREKIRGSFDADAIKAKIEELFGKGNDVSEQLLQKLKEKGGQWKERILSLIDRLVGDREDGKRSVKEVFEQLRDYFRELRIDLKERFSKFGEWARGKYEQGLERGKDRVENLRKLAREYIKDAELYGKDFAVQARDFFREYKEDLGNIYEEVKEKVREVIERKRV